jgi:hypothetical protein
VSTLSDFEANRQTRNAINGRQRHRAAADMPMIRGNELDTIDDDDDVAMTSIVAVVDVVGIVVEDDDDDVEANVVVVIDFVCVDGTIVVFDVDDVPGGNYNNRNMNQHNVNIKKVITV